MPRIDIDALPERKGSDYPAPYDRPCADRARKALGDAGGLTDFGVNLLRLPPGTWSSQRHWHSHEDEFIHVIAGEVVLVEDDGETVLGPGDCAAFRAGDANGHHLVNRGENVAVLLEIGARRIEDLCTYADIDMVVANADDYYVRKDGGELG